MFSEIAVMRKGYYILNGQPMSSVLTILKSSENDNNVYPIIIKYKNNL